MKSEIEELLREQKKICGDTIRFLDKCGNELLAIGNRPVAFANLCKSEDGRSLFKKTIIAIPNLIISLGDLGESKTVETGTVQELTEKAEKIGKTVECLRRRSSSPVIREEIGITS